MFLQYESLRSRSVNDTLKSAVMFRDNFSCRYCGISLTLQTAHMDHAIPRSKGGLTILGNLRASCQSCNLEKGDKTEEQYVSKNALAYLGRILGLRK